MASKAIIIVDDKKMYAYIFQCKDLFLITSYLLCDSFWKKICICFCPRGLRAEATQIFSLKSD